MSSGTFEIINKYLEQANYAKEPELYNQYIEKIKEQTLNALNKLDELEPTE